MNNIRYLSLKTNIAVCSLPNRIEQLTDLNIDFDTHQYAGELSMPDELKNFEFNIQGDDRLQQKCEELRDTISVD